MKEEVKNWWERAKKDLNTAKNSLNSGDYYATSLFSQQSAEKALKAIQLKKENKIIKTHDLLFLAKKLEIPENLIENCRKLKPVYIETRYPDASGGFKDFSKVDGEEDVKLAKEVLIWIEKNL